MKLVSYRSGHQAITAGVLQGEEVLPLAEPGVPLLQLLRDGDVTQRSPIGPGEKVTDVTLAAPLGGQSAPPEKVMAIGMNYRDHAEEIGIPLPQSPVVFAKYANTIAGPGESIRIPEITERVDYEAELAVVIGRTARHVSADQAMDYVLGYACSNDVSARDLQFSEGGQWSRSKSLDTFLPWGPYIATRDEIPDPQNLPIRCTVNGQTVQDGNTSEMVFPVAQLVEFLSAGMTLQPGDVICTGTPPGVGQARDPQLFLQHGDEVTVEIEGLGTLRNPVVAG